MTRTDGFRADMGRADHGRAPLVAVDDAVLADRAPSRASRGGLSPHSFASCVWRFSISASNDPRRAPLAVDAMRLSSARSTAFRSASVTFVFGRPWPLSSVSSTRDSSGETACLPGLAGLSYIVWRRAALSSLFPRSCAARAAGWQNFRRCARTAYDAKPAALRARAPSRAGQTGRPLGGDRWASPLTFASGGPWLRKFSAL